jgi:hypothetical protein
MSFLSTSSRNSSSQPFCPSYVTIIFGGAPFHRSASVSNHVSTVLLPADSADCVLDSIVLAARYSRSGPICALSLHCFETWQGRFDQGTFWSTVGRDSLVEVFAS